MLTEDMMTAILAATPDSLSNTEVAAVLATIATAFSEDSDVGAVLHLNTAQAMVLSKMFHQDRTFN